MEKQIMIKHKCNEITHKIKDVINYLSLFAIPSDKFICNCSLSIKQYSVINEIKNLEQFSGVELIKIESTSTNEKNSEYEIILHLQHMEMFLNIVEKHELNVVILCDGVKIFLNDNDGDFIIINSNHKKYNMIKQKKY